MPPDVVMANDTYFRIGERVEIRSCSDYNKILFRTPSLEPPRTKARQL